MISNTKIHLQGRGYEIKLLFICYSIFIPIYCPDKKTDLHTCHSQNFELSWSKNLLNSLTKITDSRRIIVLAIRAFCVQKTKINICYQTLFIQANKIYIQSVITCIIVVCTMSSYIQLGWLHWVMSVLLLYIKWWFDIIILFSLGIAKFSLISLTWQYNDSMVICNWLLYSINKYVNC